MDARPEGSEGAGKGEIGAGWIPRRWRGYAWRMAGLASPLLRRPSWWAAAAAVGAVPVALGWWAGSALHQPITAFLLFFLLLAAVREDRFWRGAGALAVGFGAHAAVSIALARYAPEGAAAVMPDGDAYWRAQLAWITTGSDPEYEWANWIPAHLHLLVGCIVLGVLSFGLTPLEQGMYEIDLMNFYVGRLIAASSDPVPALLFGWHPWSVLRGLGYLVLVYELSSWSLERFTGRPLSAPARRRLRWAAGLALVLADGVVKIAALGLVQGALAANLRGGAP